MKAPLKIVIADNELSDRLVLKNLLASHKNIEVISEVESVPQILEVIKRLKPDLILLDILIPYLLKFESIGLLPDKCLPLIAVISASDKYAIEAFRIGAIDYLLKPVDPARLIQTLHRACERLNAAGCLKSKPAYEPANLVPAENLTQLPALEYLPLKEKNETVLLPVGKITSIVANQHLLSITTIENQQFLIKNSLKDLEKRLGNKRFMQISRGIIINIEMIEKIFTLPGGVYQILMKNNQQFKSSRIQSRLIRKQFLTLRKLP